MFIVKQGLLSCSVDFEKGKIVSLKKGDFELLSPTLLPLFRLSFRDEEGNQILTDAFSAAKAEVKEEKLSARAVYSGLSVKDVTVTATAVFDEASEELRWKIAVDNRSDFLLEWVEYPCVAVKYCLKNRGGDGKILWPYNEGVLVDDLPMREGATFRYKEPKYPSEGCFGIFPSMVQSQFLAFLADQGGLYLGAHDKRCGLKGINFHQEGEGIQLQIRIYAASPAHTGYATDFDVVFKVFEGDWYSAAEIYRRWFEENKPEDLIPIEENKNLPDWYEKSPVIVTYPVRGLHDKDDMTPNKLFPYMNAMPILEKISRDTEGKVMALLMHWEGTGPWCPPYVWPPFGGVEVFNEFRDALHQSGNLLGVYCSGIGFTEKSNLVDYDCTKQIEEEHLLDIMCKGPDQKVAYSVICPGQRSGYDMCPACEKTKEIIEDEVQKMVDGGVDYIQVLDQNHGGNSYFCYAKDHGHPAAPGQWMIEEERELLKRIVPKDKPVLLGCESAASEPYIPYLLMSDNRFELNFKSGTPVPLYAYIYHRYLNNFMGNQCGLNFELNRDDFLYRLAYSFAAGDFPTLILTDTGELMEHWCCKGDNFHIRLDYDAVIALAKNGSQMRRGIGKDYLLSGQMLRPFEVKTKAADTRFKMVNRDDLVVPALLTSAFRASDGSIGQVVINYNRRDVEFAVDIPKGYECVVYRDGSGEGAPGYGGEALTIDKLGVMLFVCREN